MTGVICGVQSRGHDASTAAVAAALAVMADEPLALVHVVPVEDSAPIPAGEEVVPPAQVRMRQALEGLAGSLPCSADCEVLEGDPRHVLLEHAISKESRFVVVGGVHRRRLGAALLGEMATYLAGRAPCPVMVVPPEVDDARARLTSGQCVLAGVVADEPAVLRTALRLAADLGRPTVLAHVTTSGAADAEVVLADAARVAATEAPAVPLLRRCAEGEPGAVLRALADEHDAAALVVGSRGRGPLLAGLLGSTSRMLCADAPCPVVVCPGDGR